MERKLKNSKHTIEKMHQAMIVLLNKKTFEKISVIDITKQAGINRTTFYLFYSSKEELLSEMYSTFLDRYIDIFIQSLRYEGKVDVSIYASAFEEVIQFEKMLKVVWNVRIPEYEPYFIMKSAIVKAVKDFLEKNELRVKYGGTADFFALLYAANVMAIVEWWLYNYKESDKCFIINMIEDSCNKGLLHMIEKHEKNQSTHNR